MEVFAVFSSKSPCKGWRQGPFGLQCGIQTCLVAMTSLERWWWFWRTKSLMILHHTGTPYKRGWDISFAYFFILCHV